MEFHTFGSRDKNAVILIHGALTPWQIWSDAAEHFSKDHYVIVPELDAHTEYEPTVFASLDEEVSSLEKYITDELGGKVFLICGLSLGGAISYRLLTRGNVTAEKLILDGAPLMKLPSIPVWAMANSYINIIRRSKNRDPKTLERCKTDFLPERYIDDFLKIADNMDEGSIVNMLGSVFAGSEIRKIKNDPDILFMHGTKGNESLSRRSAAKMKEQNPQTVIKIFDGYAHAQLCIFENEKWIDTADGFLGAE